MCLQRDFFPQALAFLEAECKFATVANEVQQHRQALVEMLCSLLQVADLLLTNLNLSCCC